MSMLVLFFYETKGLCLKEEVRNNINFLTTDTREIVRQKRLISNIDRSLKKVLRYELYFSEFYPKAESAILAAEALEYHIHSYLEDVNNLKNKIETYLNNLSKCNAVDKSSVRDLKVLIKDKFAPICRLRDEHAHQGALFIDGDVVDALMNYKIQNDLGYIANISPNIRADIANKTNDSFEIGRSKWKKIASDNQTFFRAICDGTISATWDMVIEFAKIDRKGLTLLERRFGFPPARE